MSRAISEQSEKTDRQASNRRARVCVWSGKRRQLHLPGRMPIRCGQRFHPHILPCYFPPYRACELQSSLTRVCRILCSHSLSITLSSPFQQPYQPDTAHRQSIKTEENELILPKSLHRTKYRKIIGSKVQKEDMIALIFLCTVHFALCFKKNDQIELEAATLQARLLSRLGALDIALFFIRSFFLSRGRSFIHLKSTENKPKKEARRRQEAIYTIQVIEGQNNKRKDRNKRRGIRFSTHRSTPPIHHQTPKNESNPNPKTSLITTPGPLPKSGGFVRAKERK